MAKFQKGASGNPNGRPKVAEEFRLKCRQFVDEHVLKAWQDEVLERGANWPKAAELLAAYGYGKPAQPLEHGGADGEALDLVVRFVGGRVEEK